MLVATRGDGFFMVVVSLFPCRSQLIISKEDLKIVQGRRLLGSRKESFMKTTRINLVWKLGGVFEVLI